MSDVRVVRVFLRSRGRAPVTWSDRYVTGFGLVVAALVLAHPVAAALATLTAFARQAGSAQVGAGLALIAVAYAGFLRLARTFGPVVLPAADAAWLVLSPLPRRPVLARTSLVLLAVSVVGGAALGVGLLAVLGGAGGAVHVALPVAAALTLGVSATLGGMAAAVVAQSSHAWDSRFATAVAAVTVVAVLAAVLAGVLGAAPGRHVLAGLAAVPPSIGAVVAAACAATTAFLVRQA
jgi:hypothetical protein